MHEEEERGEGGCRHNGKGRGVKVTVGT